MLVNADTDFGRYGISIVLSMNRDRHPQNDPLYLCRHRARKTFACSPRAQMRLASCASQAFMSLEQETLWHR